LFPVRAKVQRIGDDRFPLVRQRAIGFLGNASSTTGTSHVEAVGLGLTIPQVLLLQTEGSSDEAAETARDVLPREVQSGRESRGSRVARVAR